MQIWGDQSSKFWKCGTLQLGKLKVSQSGGVYKWDLFRLLKDFKVPAEPGYYFTHPCCSCHIIGSWLLSGCCMHGMDVPSFLVESVGLVEGVSSEKQC